MQIDTGFIFSLLSALITLGSLCVGFGILKGKLDHAIEENKVQSEQFKNYAAKDDLAALTKRTDEDRKYNEDQHRTLFSKTDDQSKQISELNATLKALKESVDEVKNDIKSGLKEIQEELKELRRRT
jgi:outer membrane murein-binding lipoprotein Lpp